MENQRKEHGCRRPQPGLSRGSLPTRNGPQHINSHPQTFVTDVWHLLTSVSGRSGQDNLAMAATRFLTTVARSVHHALFAEASVLQQICESIVLPNLRVGGL